MKVLFYSMTLILMLSSLACEKQQKPQSYSKNLYELSSFDSLDYDQFLDYIFAHDIHCIDEYEGGFDPCHCDGSQAAEDSCQYFADHPPFIDAFLVGDLFADSLNYFDVTVHHYDSSYYYFIADRPDDCYQVVLTLECCFQWMGLDFNYSGVYPNPYSPASCVFAANTLEYGCLVVYRVPEFLEQHRQRGGLIEYEMPVRYGHQLEICE